MVYIYSTTAGIIGVLCILWQEYIKNRLVKPLVLICGIVALIVSSHWYIHGGI